MRKKRQGKQFSEVGDTVETTRCGNATLVGCIGSGKCYVKFEDGTVVKTYLTSFRKGQVANPYHPSMAGVGFIGVPEDGVLAKDCIEYKLWSSMFGRCYRPRPHDYRYKGCTVDPRWHNFQDFRKWFKESEYQPGWELDKDVVVKGNKVYGPDTSFFVPKPINNFLVLRTAARGGLPIGVTYHKKHNLYYAQLSKFAKQRIIGAFECLDEAFHAYKAAKEEHARELAALYKGQINDKVYDALNNYVVLRND